MPAHWALGRKGRRVPNGVGCYVAAIHPLFTGPPLPNEYIHNGVEWREADAITVFGYGKVDVVSSLMPREREGEKRAHMVSWVCGSTISAAFVQPLYLSTRINPSRGCQNPSR